MPLPAIPLLVSAGLTLLPKIPELWGAIAGLFGAKVPDSVTKAGELANSVLGSLTQGAVSPETQLKLQELINQHEEKIKEIALREQELVLKEKTVEYDLMKGSQDVEKAAYLAPDEYVRRTRPMILRKLFYLICVYVFFAPGIVALGSYYRFDEATLNSVVGMLEYIAGFLFGTFSISFTGYVIGRTQEKKAGLPDGTVSESMIQSFGSLPGLFRKK